MFAGRPQKTLPGVLKVAEASASLLCFGPAGGISTKKSTFLAELQLIRRSIRETDPNPDSGDGRRLTPEIQTVARIAR